MAEQVQGQFGYQTVQLIKTQPLGTGSYGAVYKAKCDDLPCAAKILHPTLFQFNDPGAMTVMRRFRQECTFVSGVRHPNIVQYLGSYRDPDTQLPVLLMELMDESLTHFLERSQEPLPYHVQVDLCHDITLALAYLHSNDIIHRDLSSNNVLVIGAGNRAKVTDFGMAKLFDVNRTNLTPLTMCPGTLAYMSPEALDDPPVYTKKLDCFSFGALDIQIITRQFPDPGPRVKKVHDPHSPVGKVQVPVPETERRKSHIDLISPSHPLLPIATACLSYNEEDRPLAQELCHRLAALKAAPQYGESVQQAQETNIPALSVTADGEGRERQIRELQQEKEELQQQQEERDEQIQDLQRQLQDYQARVQEKDTVIAAKQQENQALCEEIQNTRRQNHELLVARSDTEGQLSVLQQQIKEQQDELGAVGQELEDARRQLKIQEAQVEDLEQLASARNDDTERLSEELHQVTQQLEEQRMIVSNLQISAGERQTQLEKAQHDLCAAQKNVVDRFVHEALQQTYENLERYYVRVNGQLKGSQETIQVLVEKNKELVACVEQCRKEFQQQIKEQQDELGAVGQELEDARRQLKIREAQVEDLEQLASARNDDTERLSEELHQVTQQLEEQRMIVSNLQISAGERQTQLEKAQQDLCAAQKNVVDRSVHEALQQTYENLERYYVRVNGQLKGSQETIQVLVEKNKELVACVEQCRKEFEAKASECVELQRQLKRGDGGEVGDEVGALRQRVRELEEGQEEVQQSCAIAAQQLTSRQKESKQQQERIVELEQMLAQLQRDYEDLEDKHDCKLLEKNDTLEHQQKALDEKVAEVSAVREEKARLEGELQHLQEEKGKLERTVHQQRRQIEATRAADKAKKEGMRVCPVCHSRFPARIGQADFERHVQAHFD